MSVPGVWGGQRSSDPGNHSYGWLWTTMKELGIKTRPSARATYALNHWAVSPTSLPITSPAFLSRRSLSPGYSVWPQSASNTLTTQVNQSVVDWQDTALTSDSQTFNLAEICKELDVSLRTKWNSDPVTWIDLEATTLHAEKTEKLPDSTLRGVSSSQLQRERWLPRALKWRMGICSLQTQGFIQYGDPA